MKKTMLIAISTILGWTLTQNLSAEGSHAHKHKPAEKAEDHTSHNHGNAHWASPKAAAARVNPVKSDSASISRGRKHYELLCVSCHGVNALGDGPAAASMNPKPTNLKAMSGGHPDGDFAWKIANGRGAMPAWKEILKDEQIWDLVNFIQALENPNGKGKMMGMDHSKMSMDDMKNMDHSNEDDHHKVEKVDDHGHAAGHSH